MSNNFRSGKTISVLLALSLVFLSIAIFTLELPLPATISLMIALLLLLTGSIQSLRGSKRLQGQVNSLTTQNNLVVTAIKRIESEITSASVGNDNQGATRPSVNILEAPQDEIIKEARGENTFAPSFIRPITPTSFSSSTQIGRLAADFQTSINPAKDLGRLMESRLSRKPCIAVVANEEFCKELEEHGSLNRVLPRTDPSTLDPSTAFLLIDEQSFEHGPWSGVQDAQGTRLAIQLFNLIIAAKKMGILVAIKSTSASSHHSQTFREYADLIISPNGELQPEQRWETIPTIKFFAEYEGRK